MRMAMMSMQSNEYREQIVALLPRLRRFALSLTSNREDADDLVQAACERALNREHQWQPGTRLDSWLFRIIYTLRIDKTRSMRESKVHVPFAENAVRQETGGNDNKLEAKLMLQRVLKVMRQLPENDRLILALVCIDGMSYKHASATLQVPLGTVMSRLARARRKLYALVNGAQEQPQNQQ